MPGFESLYGTSGAQLDEAERKRLEQEAMLRRLIGEDIADASRMEANSALKMQRGDELLQRNLQAIDPAKAGDARGTATKAMLQQLADKYGSSQTPGVNMASMQQRQAGPMSDLTPNQWGQRQIALANQSQTAQAPGVDERGRPIRMPGEPPEEFIKRAMAGPGGPANGAMRDELRKKHGIRDRQPLEDPSKGIHLGYMPPSEANRQNQANIKKSRDLMKQDKADRMAAFHTNQQQKRVAKAEQQQFNRMTAGMTPEAKQNFLGNLMKARFDSEQKKYEVDARSKDVAAAAESKAQIRKAELVAEYQKQYPLATKQDIERYTASLGLDSGGPTVDLGPPSDIPSDPMEAYKHQQDQQVEMDLNSPDLGTRQNAEDLVVDKINRGEDVPEEKIQEIARNKAARGEDPKDFLQRAKTKGYQEEAMRRIRDNPAYREQLELGGMYFPG